MHQETSEELAIKDNFSALQSESAEFQVVQPISLSLYGDSLLDQSVLSDSIPSVGQEYVDTQSLQDCEEIQDCEEEEKLPPTILLREASNSDPVPPESQDQYFQFLKNFRLTTYNMWNHEHSKFSHHLGPQAEDFPDSFTNRINKEIKILARDLPCERDGSIFITFEEKRLDLLKSLLMGPVDTPYAFGLYQFHIALPSNYPNSPPKVKITTTGGGNVRFNPNLYDDGYVCLSIINTWDGSPEEMWNPSISNLFQVLVSIQALVMDNLVLQKEPGYEDYEQSHPENKAYCAFVKYNNVKWAMLDLLKNPPVEFRKAIRLHFAFQKERILETVQKWLEEDNSDVAWNDLTGLAASHNNDTYQIFNSSSYKALLSEVFEELKELLATLPSPQEIEQEEFEYLEPKDFAIAAPDYEEAPVSDVEPTMEETAEIDPPKDSPAPLVLEEPSENDPQAPESSCEYYVALKSHRFNTFDILNQSSFIHIDAMGSVEAVQSMTSRYTKEMKVLSNYLPCDPTAAIFVAMDSNRMDVMKALISGVDDTPYAYGLYLFDILCPESYPTSPPLVKIATTGNGEVRFNPNLYGDGYVCLSIINTWSGSPEEMWSPQYSNIYQVLLSIQSLVMDSMIIQKEPNYESLTRDEPSSQAYVNIVRYNNVKQAMINNIRNPPPEFSKIVHYHFAYNKQSILELLEKWLEEAKADTITYESVDYLIHSHNPVTATKFSTDGYYNSLLQVVNELKEELDKLPPKEVILSEINKEFPPLEPQESTDLELPPLLMKHVSSSGFQPPESQSLYFKALKELRFNSFDIINSPEGTRKHSIISEAGTEESIQAKSKRYAKEMKVLSRDLPCETSGSIFVVVDEVHMSVMHALISGVTDTPYAHGLYMFDIACPENFPEKPPMVKIATTGSGYVRFNPNLYADGYVCLSIINTWSGSPEEMWSPETSSLLQVLLSIQVLVMDNDVIAKEPGYEGYATDSIQNQMYCNIVKYNNIKYAIIDMIKNPPLPFKDVIKTHFLLKEQDILKTVENWLQEIEEKNSETETVPVDDPDGLIESHNLSTLCIFNQRPILESFKELQVELIQALNSLHDSEPDLLTLTPSQNTDQVFAQEPEEPQEPEDPQEPESLEVPLLLRAASSSDPVPPESETKYYLHLNPLKFNTHKILEEFNPNMKAYLPSLESMNSRASRLGKEVSVLSKHLPCEAEGSVFVQMDETRMDMMRALISGPIDTPYSHGLYQFDIVCPENYPTEPPNMNIITTGGSQVRFNPNLYSDGYICLSIINTWDSNPEEMWNPSHSNILQVLLSIQFLVMDDKVIHKEPGYEGYDKDGPDNLSYVNIVRYNNIKYAMIDNIRNPPSGFETIVQKHFSLKKKEINLTLDKWLEEASNSSVDWNQVNSLVLSHNTHTISIFQSKGYEKSLQELVNELRELLNNLEDF